MDPIIQLTYEVVEKLLEPEEGEYNSKSEEFLNDQLPIHLDEYTA